MSPINNKKASSKKVGFPLEIFLGVVFLIVIGCVFMPKLSPVKANVTIEAGNLTNITLNEFVKKPDSEVEFITDTAKIDLSHTGEHTVEFAFKGNNYTSSLHIVDTTPPSATAVNKEVYSGETLTANDFVTDIKDCSEVKIEFEVMPDFTSVGEQNVNIRLTDTSDNTSIISAKLKVITDTEPPKFNELTTISAQVGSSVSYRKDVTVTDNRDKEVNYTFDNSAVDLQTAGEYKVVYTATDSSGNTATATRVVKVTAKPVINEEYVKSLAKKVTDKITTQNMTAHQKIEAIFNWVRKNMVYVSSPETELVEAAYVGFTKKRGDCYNYYSVTKLLLDECGIQNMKVDRYGGKTSHYWHLVNIGTGWYHYDTTPQSLEDPYRCFMKTNEQVWAYAKSRHDGRSDYYNFDETKYPKVATEKYKSN